MDVLNYLRSSAARRRVSALLLVAGCVPHLDVDESTVRDPRVIAIQAVPAEAAAGDATPVTYRALFVDEHGEHQGGILAWFECLAPKPLAELGPISKKCLHANSPQTVGFGRGESAKNPVPDNACALFGPIPPAPVDGEPPGRPVDADQTGGYQYPIILGVNAGHGESVELYQQRIVCGLANANQAQSAEFNQRYRRNENPRVERVQVTREHGDKALLDPSVTLEVERGEHLALALRWPECPSKGVCGDHQCGIDETVSACPTDCETPVGCTGQERYVYFDPQARAIVDRQESMRVAWYATGGTYDDERTGVSESEIARESPNGWTAPEHAGDITLWFVLRDSRGGVGFTQAKLRVR